MLNFRKDLLSKFSNMKFRGKVLIHCSPRNLTYLDLVIEFLPNLIRIRSSNFF